MKSFKALIVALMLSPAGLPSSTEAQVAAPPPPPPATIWSFLGIPQGARKVHGALFNTRGNHPRLEKKPPLKALADPANLESPNPAIKKAAEVKQAEDLAPQKIKAIKYLASIGCGCYDIDDSITNALVDATKDCTESVRLAALEAIHEKASGSCCSQCGLTCCCKEPMLKRLAAMGYERDDAGCYIEPSARVRQAAIRALCACCPGSTPITVLEELPKAEEEPKEVKPVPDPETPKPPVPDPETPAEEGGETVRIPSAEEQLDDVAQSTVDRRDAALEILRTAPTLPAQPAPLPGRALISRPVAPATQVPAPAAPATRAVPAPLRSAGSPATAVAPLPTMKPQVAKPQVAQNRAAQAPVASPRGMAPAPIQTQVRPAVQTAVQGVAMAVNTETGRAHVHLADAGQRVPVGTMLTIYPAAGTNYQPIGVVEVTQSFDGSVHVVVAENTDPQVLSVGVLVAQPLQQAAPLPRQVALRRTVVR